MGLFRFFLAIALVSIVGLTLHIYLLNVLNPIIMQALSLVHIAQPPYNSYITSIAYITAIFPAAGQVVIYYFLAQYLPFNRVTKGTIFAILILLANGELIRLPVMDLLVGNPFKVVVLQHAQAIIIELLIGLIIAFTLPTKK